MGQPVPIANMDFFKVPAHAPLAQIVEAIEGGASLMIWSAPVCPRCAPISERACGPGRTRSSTPRPKPYRAPELHQGQRSVRGMLYMCERVLIFWAARPTYQPWCDIRGASKSRTPRASFPIRRA
jgi:hypothetical protein